jgi:REP-associated tyrosine transposase
VTCVPRSARGILGDGFFHVTARGNGRALLFLDEVDYRAFLRLLANVAAKSGWRLHAYCLMPNHFHLVVESRGPALSAGMRALNGGYAQYFNNRHDRSGHLFQGRYGARLIEQKGHWDEARRYVVENPVRAGMCERVEDYPWSALLLHE